MPDEECLVVACTSRRSSKGWCRFHYKRHQSGIPMDKPKRGSTVERDEQGRKLCWGCWEWTPPTRFARTSNAPDELDSRCHRCRTLGRHGLTKASFAGLLELQNGRCGNLNCGATAPGGRGSWHVDHDHACCPGKWACVKCTRGLLCHNCNIALGLLHEDPKRISGLAAYVADHRLKLTFAVNEGESK